ncbi:MAG TPA: hypothetical protein PLC53_01260 [Bacilli bacterium]|nr:hypothetical protein [Bacilli bacterium]
MGSSVSNSRFAAITSTLNITKMESIQKLSNADFDGVKRSFLNASSFEQISETLKLMRESTLQLNFSTINYLLTCDSFEKTAYGILLINCFSKLNTELTQEELLTFIQKLNPVQPYTIYFMYCSAGKMLSINSDVYRRELVGLVSTSDEDYKVDFICQYMSDKQKYANEETLVNSIEVARRIAESESVDQARNIYQDSMKNFYNIKGPANFEWGTVTPIKIQRKEIR